jgi:TetR/AcrR family transcriptional regulator, transcriptional repressor for nem operon
MKTKQQIIQKAFALFMTRSYHEVTLNVVLKETGISKGGFYHHFTSKEELFESVVEQFFFGAASEQAFIPSEEKSFFQNMEDFLTQKQNAFSLFADQMGIEYSEINFFMFIMQAIQYLPGARQKVTLFMVKEKQQILKIIETAIQRKEIRADISASKLADMLILSFDGVEMHGVMLSQSFETLAREKDLVKHLYEWIKL